MSLANCPTKGVARVQQTGVDQTVVVAGVMAAIEVANQPVGEAEVVAAATKKNTDLEPIIHYPSIESDPGLSRLPLFYLLGHG
jgi:hypothetical protein